MFLGLNLLSDRAYIMHTHHAADISALFCAAIKTSATAFPHISKVPRQNEPGQAEVLLHAQRETEIFDSD